MTEKPDWRTAGGDQLAAALVRVLESAAQTDGNGQPANVVDALAGLTGAVAAAGRDIRAGLEELAATIRQLLDAAKTGLPPAG